MLFSQSAKYAIAALRSLSLYSTETPVLIRDLSEQIDAPYHYLSKLTQLLVKRGLISSIRGRNGGVLLPRPAGEISLGDVVEAIDGHDSLHHCLMGPGKCGEGTTCAMHASWQPVRQQNLDFIFGTTIADIAAERR